MIFIVRDEFLNLEFIIEQNKDISAIENSLVELMKSILFYKVSKSKDNKEKYKNQIMSNTIFKSETKEFLNNFGEVDEEIDTKLNSSTTFMMSEEVKYPSIEECFKPQPLEKDK